DSIDVLALNEALTELESLDPLKAQIVHLRYFVGMSAAETAEVLGIAERTLHRHWRFIKAWLGSRLGASPDLAWADALRTPVMAEPSLAQIEALFHSAAALPADERSAFLNGACAGDPLLRATVEELLRHDDAGGALESPVARAAAALRGDEPTVVGH